MTKRKVKFAEKPDTHSEEPVNRRFKENHSLDSDEEDHGEKETSEPIEDVLDEEDIEGQEDETIRNDEGITVTPFNLKDELEEGHFDAQGNYIANKSSEEVTDGWLDSVDWGKVKAPPVKEHEDMNVDFPILDVNKTKKEMVEIMKAGETVLKTLRRLGGNKKPQSSADRWKKKKNNTKEEPEDEETKRNKEALLRLTGLADDLLQNGDFQIYEKTYEKLSFEIKDEEQFEDAEEQSDDELEAAFNKTDAKASDDAKTKTDDSNVVAPKSDEVSWVYKMLNTEDSELLGPFGNSQMMAWKDEGRFEKPVYCRKSDSDGAFYSSSRLDFDLYS